MSAQFRQNPKVEAAPLNEEAILFDPDSSQFFMLNRTSSFLWSRLATPASSDGLAEEICRHFAQIAPAQAMADVERALAQMVEMGLVLRES